MTALYTFMMVGLMVGLVVGGALIGRDLFERMGWIKPALPELEVGRPPAAIPQVIMPLRAAPPKAQSQRKRIVEAMKGAAEEPLPESTEDRKWAARKKVGLIAACALAYVISPIDFAPDFIPLLGQMDDLGVIIAAVRYAAPHWPIAFPS